MAAYEYFLRGRRHFYQLNEEGWAKSREEFSRAIELDSVYAMAYAGLAEVYYTDQAAAAAHMRKLGPDNFLNYTERAEFLNGYEVAGIG